MADIQANIGIGVDTTQALAAIRQLQREISVFHTLMAKGSATNAAKSAQMQQGLINTINETGRFSAGMTNISSSTESFTNALEKNKLSMGQYFRYAGGASRSFGKMFSREFSTISRVAQERVKDLQTQYISMGRDANGALQAIKVRPLALDMNNLGTKVQMVAQKQQLFNQLLRQGSTNLLNFGKNTQWAGRQLMVGFTIPLTMFGVAASREFMKLEEQVVKFKRVYGDMFTTDADTDKALNNVRELANEFTKYGIAVEKTIGLAAKVAQMGNVGTDLTAQVTQATRLAVLGGMEQEDALDTTISLTNAFGIAAEDLAGKIAFLNAAENQTILSIEDFNEAIPKAGSVVQQLGGSVEDLAFFLTAMREGGINASQGANALKTSLARIVAPTEVAKKEMAGFGIDIVGIVENNVGNLKQTIVELGQELDSLDPLNRARAIEQLFGKFQFARMSTMFQNISKDGSQAQKVLDLTANSTEELAIIAERELARVEDSVSFKFQKQLEKLQAALAPIGAEFLKAVTPLVEFGTKLLNMFNNLGDGGKQFAVIATALAGVVLPAALMGFGLVANGIANLIKFVAFLGTGFARLSGQSRILGTGTEYMTQEQIQAAAVAASLGQAHNNLLQVFTAEASAVARLVAQYNAAVVAQRQLAIGRTARSVAARPIGPRPKGFATGGIIRGPGTGTSDSIMAMLSNGEAVIPAARVKENPGIIEQLISGNIPGYSEGTTNVLGKDVSVSGDPDGLKRIANRLNKISTIIPGILTDFANSLVKGSKMSAKTLKTKLGKLAEDKRRLISMSEYTEAGGASPAQSGMVGAHTGAKTQVDKNQATTLAANLAPGRAREMMEQSNGGTLHSEMVLGLTAQENAHKGGKEELSLLTGKERAGFYKDPENQKMIGSYLQDGGQVDLEDSAQSADFTTFTSLLAAKLEAAGESAVSEADYAKFTSEAVDEMPDGKAKAGIQRAENTYKTFNPAGPDKKRYNLPTGESFVRDPETEKISHTTEVPGGSYQQRGGKLRPQFADQAETAALTNVKNAAESQGYETENIDALIQDSKEVGKNAARGIIDGADDELDNSSPSRRMFQVGKDGAKGLINGATETFKTGAPELPGSLAPPPPPVTSTPVPKTRMQRFADKVGDSAPGKFVGKKLAQASGNAITDSKGQVYYDPNEDTSTWAGKMTAEDEAFRASLPNAGSSGGVVPVQVVDGQYEMDPKFQETVESGNVESENLAKTMKVNSEATEDSTSQDNAAIKEEKRQNRQSRAGKALGALGTATMVAGMATQAEGQVGEVAQKMVGPLAALSGIAPILMALPLPLAALVAVIGLGVAAWMLYNKTLEKARKEAFGLTRALGSGKDAIKKFAEASGKATSSEIMDKKREDTLNPYETQPGKTPFGESFVGSENGAALVDSLKTAISSRGMDFAQESLSRQLQAALLDGTLTIQQARGIALALGQELDDLGLSMRVNAELNEIFGPEGENLLENPLEIQVNFMENTTDSILEASTDFENTMEGLSFWNTVESVSEGYITEMEKVAPWLEENVPTWARVASLGIIDVGANSTAAAKGLWKGGLEPVKEYGEAAGHYVGELINGLESYQGAIDSTSTRYDRMIADAESEGNGTLASELRAEKIQAEIDILKAYQQQMQTVSKDFTEAEDEVRSALSDEIDIQLKTKFEEDPEQKKILDQSLEKIAALGLDEETEYFLKLNVAADNFSLTTLDYLSGLEDGSVVDAAVDVAMNIGGKDADLAVQVAKMFGSDAEGLESQTEFLTRLSTEDPEGAKKTLSAMTEFAKLTGLVGKDADIYMRAALEMDETKMENFQKDMDYLNGLDGAEITTKMITEHIGEDVAGIISDNQEYFDSLAPDQQLRYTMIVNTLMTAVGSPEFTNSVRAWAASKGWAISISDDDAIALAPRMIADLGDRGTRGAPVASVEEATPPGNTGSGGSEPQVDSLLKKLRDLRIATIDMKKGWEGMQEVLSSIFAGGTKDLNLFNGLEKQIRNLGVGEGLIAQIVGMDPEEYDKRKNELFEFDNFGNIIGAKAALTNMNEAFDAVAIGDYVNGQEKFITKTKNQISGISTLVASGMSLADAYEAVQDEALAAAIAQGATREEIEEILRVTKLAKELEKDLEAQREKSRISEAVRKTNEEFRNQVAVLKELSKAQGEYSDEQIKAIMTDTDMQKLLLDPTIDSDALKEALRNAEQQANLSVQVNLLTKSGQEEEFDKYLTEINDYFTKKENGINVNFDLATADDNKLIEDAQNQIADIQYKLDDYNAELEQISWIEEDINEKYDRRSEALDQIADTNERIANEQKAQLDIADALSRGDIAAAARAAQELRNQQSQDAQQTQKEQLDKAREAELKAILGPAGRSREQLEEEITQLERQLFFIEEDVSEPAQERNRLAGIARDLAVEQLMLNEMTRAEFDQIAASTKEASINLEDMVTSAEKLSALAEFIKTGTKGADWNRLFPQPKAARRSAPSGGGGAKAASSGPNVTKGDWYDPGTGGTIKAAAAAKGQHWTTYYNENRGAIDPAARVNKANGGMIIPKRMAVGGFVGGYSSTPVQMNMGGRVKGYAAGGFSMGSDIVPAMLTPGEYVVRRRAVQDFGMENLEKINSGTYNDGSVYTYNLAVNVKSDADPSKIARTVITQIKQVENQRIRGNKL